MVTFLRRDYYQAGLQGLVGPRYLVEYALIDDDQSGAAITACPEGVRFAGAWPVLPVEDMERVIEYTRRAVIHAKHLAHHPTSPLPEKDVDSPMGMALAEPVKYDYRLAV